MVRLLVVGCLLAVAISANPVGRNEVVEVLEKTEDIENSTNTTASAQSDAQLQKNLTGEDPSTTTRLPPPRPPRIIQEGDRPEFAKYGTFGVNYFTENGKPYINCAFKNRTSTTATTKKCFAEPHKPLDALACMNVNMYNGTDEELANDPNPQDRIIIQNQDCWTNQREALTTCVKHRKCIYDRKELKAGQQHFCCCTEHNCNDEVILGDSNPYVDNPSSPHKPELKGGKEDSTLIIVALVICTVVAFVASAILCACVSLRYCHGGYTKGSPSSTVAPEDATLLIKQNEQRPIYELEYSDKLLGQGKYGEVRLAKWKRNDGSVRDVAVKIISGTNNKSFTNELAIFNEPCLRNYDGKNILRMFFCEQESNRDFGRIITEYHPMGNLHHYMKKNVFTPDEAKSIMASSLDALAFLHIERGNQSANYKPAILHRDVKSHNILLRIDESSKLPIGVLSDFGLSMRCSQGLFSMNTDSGEMKNELAKMNVVGTHIYMAPELLKGSTEFTISAFKSIDCYAMALVMWEILSRTKMSPDDQVPEYEEPMERYVRPFRPFKEKNFGHTIFRKLVADEKRRPDFREGIEDGTDLHKIRETIEEMWVNESEARITASCAHERIKSLMKEKEPSLDIGYHSGEHPEIQPEQQKEDTVSGSSSDSNDSRPLIIEDCDDQKFLLVDLPSVDFGGEAFELTSMR